MHWSPSFLDQTTNPSEPCRYEIAIVLSECMGYRWYVAVRSSAYRGPATHRNLAVARQQTATSPLGNLEEIVHHATLDIGTPSTQTWRQQQFLAARAPLANIY